MTAFEYHALKGQGFYFNRNIIYCSFRIKGEKFVHSTGMTLEEATRTKLIEFKNAKVAEASTLERIEKGVTVQTILDDYILFRKAKEKQKGRVGKTPTSYRVASLFKCHLSPFFGKMKPEQVKFKLNEYDELRQREGAAAPSLNSEYRWLSAAMKRGWVNEKVRQADLPKEYPFNHEGERAAARTRIFSDEEVETISKNLAPHMVPVFLTAVYTGARPQELRDLPMDALILDDDAPRIIVVKHKNDWRTGKAGKPKVLAIVDDLLPVLKAWKEDTKKRFPQCEWFFHLNGKKLGDWKTAWKGALKRSGIEPGSGVIFYDSRRTSRSKLGEYGVSKDDAKKQLGHHSDSMSDLYDQSTEHVKRVQDAYRSKGVTKPVPASPRASNDVVDRIERLAALFEKGSLTPDEFAMLKSKALEAA